MSTLFSLQNIVKNYGAVRALRGVDLDINEGDALAICGDNGAGKSTLIRILSGAENPTSGTMALRGDPVVFHNPHDALSKGVATIYHDLALAPRSTIYQNVFMGAERTRTLLPFIRVLDKKRMMAEAQGLSQPPEPRHARHEGHGGNPVGRPASGRRHQQGASLECGPDHHGRAHRRAGCTRNGPGTRPDPQSAQTGQRPSS